MKLKLKLIIFSALLMLSTFLEAKPDEISLDKKVEVKVAIDIFPLDSSSDINKISNILETEKPEYSPRLTVLSGETAVINMKDKSIEMESNDFQQIKIFIDDLAKKFDINFEFSPDEEKNNSSIAAFDIGSDLVFTTSINNTSKLIRVITKLDNNDDADSIQSLAIQKLTISKKVRLFKYEQEYFQGHKIWLHDNRRYRTMQRYEQRLTDHISYFYLTNNDPEHLIKGTIKLRSPFNFADNSSVEHIGLNNYGFRKNRLEFVVLPNQTVLLGQWANGVSLKLMKAAYVPADEVTKLKAKYIEYSNK